jgi:hypothetical protein
MSQQFITLVLEVHVARTVLEYVEDYCQDQERVVRQLRLEGNEDVVHAVALLDVLRQFLETLRIALLEQGHGLN